MNKRTNEIIEEGCTDLVLVCTNNRNSEYACCANVDGDEVAVAVREWLRERNAYWTDVYVVETSCLGLCSENGVALTIQPRNEWYSDIVPREVPNLLEKIFGPDATKLGISPSKTRVN